MSTFRLRFSIQEDAYEIQAYVPTHSMIAKLIFERDFLKDIEVIKKGRFEIKRSLTEDSTLKHGSYRR